MRLTSLVISGLMVLAMTAISSIAHSACRFRYSADIQRRIIDPEIKRRLGDGAGLKSLVINGSNPLVIQYGDNFELMFSPTRMDLLDPPSFEVLLSE
jgi:hypothetical protein